jgi:hypothetical protein
MFQKAEKERGQALWPLSSDQDLAAKAQSSRVKFTVSEKKEDDADMSASEEEGLVYWY